MAFCAKHGWEYEVDEPNPRKHVRSKRYAGYGDNYRCVDPHQGYLVSYRYAGPLQTEPLLERALNNHFCIYTMPIFGRYEGSLFDWNPLCFLRVQRQAQGHP